MVSSVIVSTEAHFTRDAQGAIYSTTGGRSYQFWKRYLDTFESVQIVARVTDNAGDFDGFEVEGPGVTVVPIRGYQGLRGTLLSVPLVVLLSWRLAGSGAAFVLRVPSVIGGLLSICLAFRRRPFALEVVGDPAQVFASGVGGKLAFIGGALTTRLLRWQCRKAVGVAYVTERTLQALYPPAEHAVSSYYSSVDLPQEAFAAEPRSTARVTGPFRVVNLGTMSQMYKGQDLLIGMVAKLRDSGLDLHLTLVGDGQYRTALQDLAHRLGIRDFVTFLGIIPAGAAVRRVLDEAHLYVLASRTEGLPRALIEAMARGIPCIGTDVGGVAELLPHRALVRPDNEDALAEAVRDVVTDTSWQNELAECCLISAASYEKTLLEMRRRDFLAAVARRTSSMNGLNA